jgi:hypothetical protein
MVMMVNDDDGDDGDDGERQSSSPPNFFADLHGRRPNGLIVAKRS